MMKRRIFKKYRTGRKKGGQRYMVGKKPKNYASSKISKFSDKQIIKVPISEGYTHTDPPVWTRFSVLEHPEDFPITYTLTKKPTSKSKANKLAMFHNLMQIRDESGVPISFYDASVERSFAKDQFRKKAGLPNKRMGRVLKEFIERRNEQNAHRGLRHMLRENYGSFGSKPGILREGGNEDVAEARRLGMKMKTPEAALRAVRLTFDRPEELECVGASCALLDPIKKFYPDAELVKLSVKMPGTDTVNSHTIIISDKSNKIIDSQAGQFKERLKLSDNFIDKGIYNIKEYSKNVPFAYAEKIDDDKRVDLFKMLKTHGG